MNLSFLAELLKSQPVEILVLLALCWGLMQLWKKSDHTSENYIELNTIVTNIRDNHLEHLAQDVSNLRGDIGDVREGVAEINRFLREK